MNMKVNPISVNKVYFNGENNANVSDKSVSPDEGIKQSTKLMIGATALAVAVIAGIALIRGKKPPKSEVLNNTVDDVTTRVRKTVHDMNEDEIAQWSETKIRQIQKLFSKKRDLTNWGKFNDAQNNPHAPIQRKGHDIYHIDEDGYLFIESLYPKSGGEIHKAYTKDGMLDSILIRNNKKFIKIHRKDKESAYIHNKPNGGFWCEFIDRSAENHRNPSVILDVSYTDTAPKYKTTLMHDVCSEQYYKKEYASVSGPKPKKTEKANEEIETPKQ